MLADAACPLRCQLVPFLLRTRVPSGVASMCGEKNSFSQ